MDPNTTKRSVSAEQVGVSDGIQCIQVLVSSEITRDPKPKLSATTTNKFWLSSEPIAKKHILPDKQRTPDIN